MMGMISLVDIFENFKEKYRAFDKVCVDSRKVQQGDLFIALKGEKTDGHRFIKEAFFRGAKAAIVEEKYKNKIESAELPLIFVEDSLKALQLLANEKIKKCSPYIIAITGSVGKTTTKEFLYSLAKKSKQAFVSPGNANSQIGLPLAILNGLDNSHELAILEMGMNQRGQIASLVEIAEPDLSIVTSVELAHVENLGSLEAIAEAKGEILSRAKTKKALISKDIIPFSSVIKKSSAEIYTFSTQDSSADFFANESLAQLEVVIKKEKILLPILSIAGKHNTHNFLAAAAACHLIGVSWEVIAEQVPHLNLVEKRLEKVEIKGVHFINDSYNACEASMKAALSTIAAATAINKRYAVLGDMFELGPYTKSCHEAVAEHALDCIDALFCYGKHSYLMAQYWKKKGREVFWSENLGELVGSLKNKIKPKDIVLIKGSQGMQMWRVLDFIKEKA